jgi:hypothetical protein
MKRTHVIRIALVLCCWWSWCVAGVGQIHYHSDCWNGGVVGDGFIAWPFGGGPSTVQLPIPEGCTVKKAVLFASFNKYEGATLDGVDRIIEINGEPFLLSLNNSLSNDHYFIYIEDSIRTIAKDITEYIDTSIDQYLIDPMYQTNPVISTNIRYFSELYILVLYESPSLPQMCLDVFVNTFDSYPNLLYTLSAGSTMDSTQQIGLALNSSHLCDIIQDGYDVHLNGHYLGVIGGKEDNTTVTCAGVMGTFDYHEHTITGIGNDTGDSLMHGLDAVANIQSYIDDAFEFNVAFDYISDWRPYSNLINQLFLTYSSNCAPFEASISENIEICKGAQATLHATGGNAYQWHPQIDLSCYDCASPVFVGDTSRFYTCRIWNTDSCSKVLPVKVNVRDNPVAASFSVAPTECYGNTGRIQVNAPSQGYTYALNGGSAQAQPLFQNLADGDYVLTAIDSNGCKADTTVHIERINTTVAQFAASPLAGNIPLEVTLSNQSTSATNYVWYIGSDTLHTASTAPFTHTFHEPGSFDIALVAYHTLEECSDTSYLSITTEYPFTVIIPTLYGGFAEGLPYGIYTSGVKSLEYKLYSNDGRLVRILEANPSAGYLPLWDSTHMASGLYIYNLRVRSDDGAEKVFTGKVVVI